MRTAAMAMAMVVGACASGSGEGPPAPEAVEACAARSLGEACSFEGPHGPVVGVCGAVGDRDVRACVPRRRTRV